VGGKPGIAYHLGDYYKPALYVSAFLVYVLPIIIAWVRRLKRTWAIFAFNLFLGWTIVGWFFAVNWATQPQKTQKRR